MVYQQKNKSFEDNGINLTFINVFVTKNEIKENEIEIQAAKEQKNKIKLKVPTCLYSF